jgi:hypothetical protein
VESLGQRLGLLLPEGQTFHRVEAGALPFEAVGFPEVVQRLPGDRALMLGVEFEELAAGMGEAAGFGDPLREEILVAGIVVADQGAPPIAEKSLGVPAGAAVGEVVDGV